MWIHTNMYDTWSCMGCCSAYSYVIEVVIDLSVVDWTSIALFLSWVDLQHPTSWQVAGFHHWRHKVAPGSGHASGTIVSSSVQSWKVRPMDLKCMRTQRCKDYNQVEKCVLFLKLLRDMVKTFYKQHQRLKLWLKVLPIRTVYHVAGFLWWL